MTRWMSSLINQPDGCLRTVTQQVTQGRIRQEQLAQSVAHSAAMPSQNDQVQYLRAQFAHRDAQLENVRSECDTHTHFVQNKFLAHIRLLNSETKKWKSRVFSEAEQVLCLEPAEAAQRATELQKTWINIFKLDGDKLKQNSEMCVNQTALKYRPLRRDCERVSWNTSSYRLHKRDSCNLRHKPSEIRKTWDIRHQT